MVRAAGAWTPRTYAVVGAVVAFEAWAARNGFGGPTAMLICIVAPFVWGCREKWDGEVPGGNQKRRDAVHSRGRAPEHLSESEAGLPSGWLPRRRGLGVFGLQQRWKTHRRHVHRGAVRRAAPGRPAARRRGGRPDGGVVRRRADAGRDGGVSRGTARARGRGGRAARAGGASLVVVLG